MIEFDSRAGVAPDLTVVPDITATPDLHLPAIAYAAFFTEAEREEIGTFDELPAPERARWESVAAHIARTVVPPVDEDIERWRAEQRAELARQVRDAPYTRDVWRATMRTANMQHQVEVLRALLVQSRESAAKARSHSRRLATTTRALDVTLWLEEDPADIRADRGPDDIAGTTPQSASILASTDRPAHQHEQMVRSA